MIPRLLEFFRTRSLKRKLLLSNLLATGCALFLVGASVIVSEFYHYRESLISDFEVQARIIGENSMAAILFSDLKAAQETLSALHSSPVILHAAIYTNEEKLWAEYRRPAVRGGLHVDRLLQDGNAIVPSSLTVTQPVEHEGRKLATVRIRLSLAQLYERLAWYSLLISLGAIAAFLTAFLLNVKLLSILSRPLIDLAQLMDKVSTHRNYSLRAPINTTDEIGGLSQGFNLMLEQIQQHGSRLEEELKERKLAERRLDQLAHYDQVTNLPNRNFFNTQLSVALDNAARNGGSAALFFLDLDNFKTINDSLGHQVGDLLLQEVALRLTDCVRAGDAVCRLGGDEFTIILPKVDSKALPEVVAKRIIGALSRSFLIRNVEIFITGSIGIGLYPDDGDDMHALIKNVDTAMYQAKANGKNNFQFFSNEMNEKALRRMAIESNLRRALERNELHLCYQPQLNLKSRSIVGFEALLRWENPELGNVSPLEFIPIAEETGLIVPIGEWVLQNACLQAKIWSDEYPSFKRMAVNVSARQFKEVNFIERVIHVLRKTKLNPRMLEMELTESVLIDNVEATIRRIHQLDDLGISLSIDDFGTGYSSMSYLKRFPIAVLKIDRSFIRDVTQDEDDSSIAKAIIAMAHSLDIEVVAEGVETQDQLEFLETESCDLIQGYYISRPIKPSLMKAFLTKFHRDESPARQQSVGNTTVL